MSQCEGKVVKGRLRRQRSAEYVVSERVATFQGSYLFPISSHIYQWQCRPLTHASPNLLQSFCSWSARPQLERQVKTSTTWLLCLSTRFSSSAQVHTQVFTFQPDCDAIERGLHFEFKRHPAVLHEPPWPLRLSFCIQLFSLSREVQPLSKRLFF